MNEIFLEELEDFIINQNNGNTTKSIKDFWKINYQSIVNSEDFLLGKFKEYAPSNKSDFTGFFYRYLYFFLLKDEKKYYSKKIIDFLKQELIEQSNTEKPEFYSNILSVIYKIEGKKSKDEFYQNQYKNIDNKGYLYSDISTNFLEIFIQLGINNKNILPEFSDLFPKVIIQSVDEIISSSIQSGWDYLVSLEKNVFNREFLNLINYFDANEIRGKLVHHHKYISLFTLGKYENVHKKFSEVRSKIESSFGIHEYKIYESFIISEVNYVLGIHERAIEKNTFISQGIDILQNKDSNFIIKLLKQLNSENNFWGLEITIVKYLQINQIEDFINILKGTDNYFTIFSVYEIIKENKNVTFIDAFEKSSYKNELKKIQKQRNKSQESSNREKEKRISIEKEDFLSMIKGLKEGQYYPKLFEDYAEYSSNNNTGFSIYTDEEKKKIDNELIRQIKVFLSYRKIEEYSQKWLDFVTFEKKEENSYSHCWDVKYMTRFIEIAQKLPELKEILKKNYKSVLLFYPLMYTYKTENFFFNEILSINIENNDIEYILKVYSGDLHENAKDLRYYQPRNFSNFYKKFKNNFKGYKKEIEKISFHMINKKDKLETYYRDEYLEIYADSAGETKYRKYWKSENKKYPKFNYFNDILKNQSEKSGKELKEMRFFLMIQTVLIEKYVKKSDIVWRIKQFKGVELKYISRFNREYPHYSGVTTFNGGSTLNEIEWSSFDRENFAYIFSLDIVGKIDVSKNMLEILKESLIIKSINDKEQDLYTNYLQKIFFKYFEVLDNNLINKKFYFKILELLEKYDFKYYYNFNFVFFRNKYGVLKIDEQVESIIKKQDRKKLKLLLGEYNNIYRQKADNNFNQSQERKTCKLKIFTEGITEYIYIQKAAKILGEEDIIENFDFDVVGINNTGKGSSNCGEIILKSFGNILITRDDHLDKKIEKAIFLHDPESQGINEVENNRIFIRQMKFLDGRSRSKGLCRSGIEALLSDNILNKFKKHSGINGFDFNEVGGKGNEHYIFHDNKKEIANWICNNGNKKDFEGFQHIFDMLKKILEY